MSQLAWCITGIVLLLGYVAFRSLAQSNTKMILNKGGRVDESGQYRPDMSRSDLQDFVKECETNEIPRAFAEEFLFQLFNMSKYLKEPPAPKFSDELAKEWAIDDDIEDLINPILSKHNLHTIKWNQSEILELRTIGDIISCIYKKTQTEHG